MYRTSGSFSGVFRPELPEENCIPFETVEMDECNYEEFLQKRRELISSRLKQYYFSL